MSYIYNNIVLGPFLLSLFLFSRTFFLVPEHSIALSSSPSPELVKIKLDPEPPVNDHNDLVLSHPDLPFFSMEEFDDDGLNFALKVYLDASPRVVLCQASSGVQCPPDGLSETLML